MAKISVEKFQFDEASHIYSIDRGGKTIQIPGVTRILDTSGLVNYRFVRPDILERKSRLGKEIHRVTAMFDLKILDFDSVDARVLPYLEAWMDFRRQTGFIPSRIEYRCIGEANGIQFGMTIDVSGFTGRRRNIDTIVEKKATVSILPHHDVQTAGYSLGLPKKGIQSALARFLSRRRIIVKLEPTGKARIHECDKREDAETFLHALWLSAWKMRFQQIYSEAA